MNSAAEPDEPYITIAVPTYAEPQRLRRLLASLSRQQYPSARAEVIVVDDGSPEAVPSEFSRLARPLHTHLIRHSRNAGRAQARNTALEHANGELILFLDSDMTAAPELLRAHAQAHTSTHDQVVIGDIRFGPDVKPTALTRYIDTRGVHRLAPGQPVSFKCFVTGNSSVPRQLLEAVGRFDPGFREYGGEDLELGYRLHRHGVRFHYSSAAKTLHHHARTLSALCELMYRYGRHSLPRLMALHPELDALVRLDFLRRPSTPRSRMLRLSLRSPVYRTTRAACQVLDSWWIPSVVLDYLLWASRTRGFIAHSSSAADR